MFARKKFYKTLSICGKVLKYACIGHCTFTYLVDFVYCSGPSMEPTIYSGDVLLTEKVSCRRNRVDRGDVITAISPTHPTKIICKRVFAVAGDRILAGMPGDLKNSSSINVSAIAGQESTLTPTEQERIEQLKGQMKKIRIPRGHVWLEGDNKDNSADSRYYGAVPQGLINSRAVAKVWPPSQFTFL
ncbi:mitochondrial inner membrane protease subunit 1 [Phlebotomus argentipes]|uniref:mitochondrial inner membrane protease subunit 1 n=1 Tax=Phlebotomus argentipes TaxID=94469 RepID=UPI002892A4FE|nr:mitochondrial inner membrane protease subunit 1 [Phlebotomus argentipes]